MEIINIFDNDQHIAASQNKVSPLTPVSRHYSDNQSRVVRASSQQMAAQCHRSLDRAVDCGPSLSRPHRALTVPRVAAVFTLGIHK